MLSRRIIDYDQMETTWICQRLWSMNDGFSSPSASIWSCQEDYVASYWRNRTWDSLVWHNRKGI